MASVPVLDCEGKALGEKELQEEFLNRKTSRHAVKAAVVALLAHQRRGTASTKTRAEVRGSGKKPWRQKGTGRARAGSRTSPVWRGGGTTFGPQPHDYPYRLNRKVSKLARESALRLKLNEGKVIVVRDFKVDSPKSKLAAQVLKNLKIEGKVLIIVKQFDTNLALAFRNLPGVDLIRSCDLNAYEILAHPSLVFSEEAFEGLLKPASPKLVEAGPSEVVG